jgi:hypothetical protein
MAVTANTRRIVRARAESRCEYCHADERWQFILNDDRHGGRVLQVRERDREDGLHPPENDPRESH